MYIYFWSTDIIINCQFVQIVFKKNLMETNQIETPVLIVLDKYIHFQNLIQKHKFKKHF